MPARPATFHPLRGLRKGKEARPDATKRGYGARWKRERLLYLQAHPLCVECLKRGRVVPATVVDHVVPHKGDYQRFWDAAGNWQSLCSGCHNRKTVREDGGFGRERKG